MKHGGGKASGGAPLRASQRHHVRPAPPAFPAGGRFSPGDEVAWGKYHRGKVITVLPDSVEVKSEGRRWRVSATELRHCAGVFDG